MDLLHYHLLLNHWPIIGTFAALGLFVLSIVVDSNVLRQTSLITFSLIGLLVIPTFTTGALAARVIQGDASISQPFVTSHQGAALVALVAAELTAAMSWIALWQSCRVARPARWTVAAVLLCAMVTAAIMTIAGNTGGEIGHPQIRTAHEPTSVVGAMGLQAERSIEELVSRDARAWPTLETLHFIGLALLLGMLGVINLRVLGFWKEFPLAPLLRLLPWGIAGLFINIVTGMMFFVGKTEFYIYNIDFQSKMIVIVVAGANLLVHCSSTAFASLDSIRGGENAATSKKLLAATSLFLWLLVIVLGRYMPLYEDTLGF